MVALIMMVEDCVLSLSFLFAFLLTAARMRQKGVITELTLSSVTELRVNNAITRIHIPIFCD